MSRPNPKQYFQTLAKFVRLDLESDDLNRKAGALLRYRRAIPALRDLSDADLIRQARHTDALDVIASEQGHGHWRALLQSIEHVGDVAPDLPESERALQDFAIFVRRNFRVVSTQGPSLLGPDDDPQLHLGWSVALADGTSAHIDAVRVRRDALGMQVLDDTRSTDAVQGSEDVFEGILTAAGSAVETIDFGGEDYIFGIVPYGD